MTTGVVRTCQPVPVLTRQQVLDLARAAHHGPSIHNTQPWRLHAQTSGLDVYEDPARGLNGTDPLGRDRVISCGAALRNAEITMARLGHAPVSTLLPHGRTGTHLAALRAGPRQEPSAQVEALYRAIWTRRTHRRIFLATRSSDHLLPAFAAAVAPFGARLAVLRTARRERFAQLVWSAAQQQARDEEMRRELAEFFAANADVATYFVPEATEHLDAITTALLALERGDCLPRLHQKDGAQKLPVGRLRHGRLGSRQLEP